MTDPTNGPTIRPLPSYEALPVSDGNVLLNHDGWLAVMDALDGDDSRRDDALDALQRWAPYTWLEELEAREEAARGAATGDAATRDELTCDEVSGDEAH